MHSTRDALPFELLVASIIVGVVVIPVLCGVIDVDAMSTGQLSTAKAMTLRIGDVNYDGHINTQDVLEVLRTQSAAELHLEGDAIIEEAAGYTMHFEVTRSFRAQQDSHPESVDFTVIAMPDAAKY
jgi:hypothetical protein